ncbi:MAG: T9SS type A sorting domain-containing protein [Flavobacteriales bacterium]|nr:T9SS type A sorting domain-containing protein [Flavobacteriales bacterium]
MRLITSLMCCTFLLPGFMPAQSLLVNGGFEYAEGSSSEGWEWNCGTPMFISNTPPNGGTWALTLMASNNDPCTFPRMFQRLPEALDGEVITLSGWLRNQMGHPITGAFLALGTLSNGMLTPLVEAGTLDYPWVHESVTWTVALNEGDTAVVILYPGEMPDFGIFSLAAFDDLELNRAVGVNELERPTLSVHQQGDLVHVATSDGQAIREARLLDAQGRLVLDLTSVRSTLEFSTSSLGSGLYVLVAHGAYGSISRKFVRE